MWRALWIVSFDLITWWNAPEVAQQLTGSYAVMWVAQTGVTILAGIDLWYLAKCLRKRINAAKNSVPAA